MKKLLLIPMSVVVLAGLALTGCAPSSNNAPSSNKANNATDGSKAIMIAYSDGGQTLDPSEATDITSDTFDVATYDRLVDFAVKDGRFDTGNYVPMLAKSWKSSADGLIWTFNLQDGVKFQSGNPFTANDVVFSLKHLENSGAGSTSYKLTQIESVVAKDSHTVVFTLKQANKLFLQYIAQYTYSILDSKLVGQHDKAWLKTNTAGSGPYKIDSWDPATAAVFLRNESYWGAKPGLAKVTIKFVSEAANRVQLAQRGTVELAIQIPAQNIADLKKVSSLVVSSDPSSRILYFGLNNKIKPFDNKLVRQALAYAVPYEQLVKDVMYGQAILLKSPLPSSMPGFNGDTDPYKTDLVKAKQLLVTAGYPNGFSFDMALGSGFEDWGSDAVLIQASFKQIGVTMNIKNMARQQFLTALPTKTVAAFMTKWTSFINDPGYHLGFLLASTGSANYTNYNNPEVDALIQQANDATVAAEATKLWTQVQEKIAADAPWLYLYQYNRVVTMNKNVSGYVLYPDEIIRIANLAMK